MSKEKGISLWQSSDGPRDILFARAYGPRFTLEDIIEAINKMESKRLEVEVISSEINIFPYSKTFRLRTFIKQGGI